MPYLFAEKLYTGTDVRKRTYLSFDDATIVDVSPKKPAGGTSIGEFAVVTPAFIDPHSHIGLYRAGEPQSDGEGNEKTRPMLFCPTPRLAADGRSGLYRCH